MIPTSLSPDPASASRIADRVFAVGNAIVATGPPTGPDLGPISWADIARSTACASVAGVTTFLFCYLYRMVRPAVISALPGPSPFLMFYNADAAADGADSPTSSSSATATSSAGPELGPADSSTPTVTGQGVSVEPRASSESRQTLLGRRPTNSDGVAIPTAPLPPLHAGGYPFDGDSLRMLPVSVASPFQRDPIPQLMTPTNVESWNCISTGFRFHGLSLDPPKIPQSLSPF